MDITNNRDTTRSQTFTYDALNRRTQTCGERSESMTQPNNVTTNYSGACPERSRGNPVGNRLSSLGLSPYTYNPSNEMVSTPTAMYVYDSNGNMTSKTDPTGTTNYTWDFENRLTSVTLPGSGGTVTFKYDPFGRRIYKSSSAGTSIFAYDAPFASRTNLRDGDNLIEEVNASGAVVARYTQGQNIDEPLAMYRSGATSYYEQDGLGSVTSLTNGAGALAQTYTFDSFGKTTNATGSLTNPFQYTAREFDSETGLYYYRARYYDPMEGRFISEDPIGFDGGIDFYAYTGNDPVEYLDPFGEIRYNFPPPRTVPPTGRTLDALKCLEHCLQCVTNNANLNLFVTGGAEKNGHTPHSYHYLGQAVDISFYNSVTTHDVFQCGEQCGYTAGRAEPARHHWHLQLTPGNGVPLLPSLLPMKPPCGSKCQ